jgi:hypothetical protein
MAFSIGNTGRNQVVTSTSNTVTISLSAGSVLLIQIGTTATSATGAAIVTASPFVSSANLTFSKRASQTRHDVNVGNGTTWQAQEVWWAYSSGALTSEVITVNLTGSPSTGLILAIECKGVANPSSPFDANGSLPVIAQGDNTDATVTGLSTNGSAPVGFWFYSSSHTNALPTTPGTWTQANIGNGSPGLGNDGDIYYQVFSSTQSSATWSSTTSVARNWLLVGDAFNSPAVYSITASEGTYALTGEAQTFVHGIGISASHGTYTLTGEATTNTSARSISIVQGTYGLTGKAVTFTAGKGLAAAQGTYTLTGEAAALSSSRSISTVHGVYTLTGYATNTPSSKSIFPVYGVYELTGKNQSLSLIKLVPTSTPPTSIQPVIKDYDTFTLWSSPYPGGRRYRVRSTSTPVYE